MSSLNRIYVGEKVDLRLRQLKGSLGLTPNLIARLGFCLSLEEPGVPDPSLYADTQAREFNRYTLTGPWDSLFFALLRERMLNDKLDLDTEIEAQFIAHLSRGVHLFYSRVKHLEDVATLVEKAHNKAKKYEAERLAENLNGSS
ncbi:DndE family protein [bacterium]|nr:DndE family protein [bacterium]